MAPPSAGPLILLLLGTIGYKIDPDLLGSAVSPGHWHNCLALQPLLLDTTIYCQALSVPAADSTASWVSSSIQGQSLGESPLHSVTLYLFNGHPKQRRLYASVFKS